MTVKCRLVIGRYSDNALMKYYLVLHDSIISHVQCSFVIYSVGQDFMYVKICRLQANKSSPYSHPRLQGIELCASPFTAICSSTALSAPLSGYVYA